MKRLLQFISIISTISLLSACANPHPDNAQDPYESYNRAAFAITMKADKYILRPIALGYNAILPAGAQVGITNAFDNVETPLTIGNDLLQGKLTFALADTARMVINTVWGVFGLFDIATDMGLPPHHEDFGMTLNYWGGNKYKPYYLVIPFLGPGTFASQFGRIPDLYLSPITYLKNTRLRLIILGADVINARANLLPADKLMQDSFDPYVFVRQFYMRLRMQQLQNNNETYTQFRERYEEMHAPLPDDVAS